MYIVPPIKTKNKNKITTTTTQAPPQILFVKIALVQSDWRDSVCEKPFSSLATDSQQDLLDFGPF